MSVRINLEIGHEAALRSKRTQEGFTHDWEVFVRGCDNANIQYYVEKVVFYLHETFPKPKRVVKEPPYAVKESGYAGFTLPIEIHLRNKDDPKKISFNYDLNLQQSGPTIVKVQKEKYVFNNPVEDFKLKLLKGGGMTVNSLNSSQDIARENRPLSDEKSQLVSKPRLGGTDYSKKLKPKSEEPHSFQAVFGTPIKTSKTSLDSKSSKDKNSAFNKSGSSEKEKSKSKHSPHKDKDKEKEKFRDKDSSDKKNKDEKKREDKKRERSKDREDKIKEKKEKKEKSPRLRSPTPTKRPLSPKRPSSPLIPKYKEERKPLETTVKEKKSSEDKEKLEKKVKKEKRDKDKDRKENRHKDKDKDGQKIIEQKEKSVIREKEKHREPSPLLPIPKSEKKDKVKEKEVIKDIKEVSEQMEKSDKVKNEKVEEKPKHKHKKKDKEKREKEKSNEKEKSHKSDKKNDRNPTNTISKYTVDNKDIQKENDKASLFNSPKHTSLIESKPVEKPKKPLNTLIAECTDSDSSISSISSHEDLFNEPVVKQELPKKDSLFDSQPVKTNIEKKQKREKSRKNKDKKAEKDGEKKRKRKPDSNRLEEPLEKISKEESSNSNLKDSDVELNPSQAPEVREENYEDYMNLLRDLQHKILMLQDSSELQRVVQLIAETGRFEISAQTFDFDLCLLERSTIKQLQNFFESTS